LNGYIGIRDVVKVNKYGYRCKSFEFIDLQISGNIQSDQIGGVEYIVGIKFKIRG